MKNDMLKVWVSEDDVGDGVKRKCRIMVTDLKQVEQKAEKDDIAYDYRLYIRYI